LNELGGQSPPNPSGAKPPEPLRGKAPEL